MLRSLTLAAIAFAVMALAGCLGISQQKLEDGEADCETVQTPYGTISRVRQRADNASKGSSTKGDTRITCGSAVMEIKSTITAPEPKPVPVK